jgi:hypothetical protein
MALEINQMIRSEISVEPGFDMDAFRLAVVSAIPRYTAGGIPNVYQISRAMMAIGVTKLGTFNQSYVIAELKSRDGLKQSGALATAAAETEERDELIGFEIGTAILGESADAIRKMVMRALELRDNPAKLRGYGKAVSRNVKTIIRAVEQFGEWFMPQKNASAIEMLIVIKIAGVKDDTQCNALFNEWREHADWTYRDIEDRVRLANKLIAKPPKRAPLAERIANHIFNHEIDKAHELICAEPEIAKDLARQARTQKAARSTCED